MKRASGLFLHPTSLPSPFGIGDLGQTAYEWVDLLHSCNQTFWQMCPLGPTGYGDSPYQSLSSFAGNTLLISPENLKSLGLLTAAELKEFPSLPDSRVDYGSVIREKEKLFHRAYERFSDSKQFLEFCEKERYWLDDFALFKVIKNDHNGQPWYSWKAPLKLRYPAELDAVNDSEHRLIRYHKFLQFMFDLQWKALREYANKQGIRIIGDIPIYVSYDSADIWSSPEQFELDETCAPLRVAGVPPDYFSATGQLWGNPLYLWQNMRQDGYSWWIKRLRKTLELVDCIRLDHFRGFESYWAVPASSETAINGEWVKGPGLHFFEVVQSQLGKLPIIAEDLGEITDHVEDLRRTVALPGMKVLQFAFDGNRDNPYLPYNIDAQSITYTGTHDNDTSFGWYTALDDEARKNVDEFLGCSADSFMERFLRLAFCSNSRLTIIPFQDVLGLGSSHRMNTPGKESGNWQWRFTLDLVNDELLKLVADLTVIYGRSGDGDFSF